MPPRASDDDWVRRKLATGEPPPWPPNGSREEKWLEDWTIQQVDLEERREAEELLNDPNFDVERATAAARRQFAISAAWRGDPEPLRRLKEKEEPDIAPFIGKPKRRKGERYDTTPRYDRMVHLACTYVYKIRDLWAMKFKHKNRKDKPTAVSIAALICHVGEHDVLKMLEKQPRRRFLRRPRIKIDQAR